MCKLLYCVVYWVVQDICIGVHNGLLIVIAGWSFWMVQFKFREGDKKENGWSVQVIVLCFVLLFQDFGMEMHDGLFKFIAW